MESLHEKKWYRIARIVVCVVLALAAAYVLYGKYSGADEQEEANWQQEGYAYMDELYAAKDYEALMDYCNTAHKKGHDITGWEHYEFCAMYSLVDSINFWRDDIFNGKGKSIAYQWLFYDEWCLIGITYAEELDEQEMEYFGEYIEQAINDMHDIFGLTDEEYDAYVEKLIANDYLISFEECEEIISAWYEEGNR